MLANQLLLREELLSKHAETFVTVLQLTFLDILRKELFSEHTDAVVTLHCFRLAFIVLQLFRKNAQAEVTFLLLTEIKPRQVR